MPSLKQENTIAEKIPSVTNPMHINKKNDAIILYNYASRYAQDLTVSKNDEVKMIEYGVDWCKVEDTAGCVGLVPTTYLKIVEK